MAKLSQEELLTNRLANFEKMGQSMVRSNPFMQNMNPLGGVNPLAGLAKRDQKKLDKFKSERERVRKEDLNTFESRQASMKNAMGDRLALASQGRRGTILGGSLALNQNLGMGQPMNQPKTLLGM
jgi:hypothetical protein